MVSKKRSLCISSHIGGVCCPCDVRGGVRHTDDKYLMCVSCFAASTGEELCIRSFFFQAPLGGFLSPGESVDVWTATLKINVFKFGLLVVIMTDYSTEKTNIKCKFEPYGGWLFNALFQSKIIFL